MSQGNQSCLRFSLEESIWFQRGQEVEELVSISLDPNITIQESDQYVTIRGSLELTGEYKRQNEKVDENDQWNSIHKWVHNVEEREDGICEFAHQFPVDITIPTYRVRDLNEIDVIIETFDYLLPERSCLKLTADLNILGLYDEQEEATTHEEREVEVEIAINPRSESVEQVEDKRDEVEELQEDLLVERAKVKELDENRELEYDQEKKLDLIQDRVVVHDQERELVQNQVQVPVQADVVEDAKYDLEYESFEAEARKEETLYKEPVLIESPSFLPSTPDTSFSSYSREQQEEAVDSTVVNQEVIKEDESPIQEEIPAFSSNIIQTIKNKISSKKSMSISEFLARKEDEQDIVKLKVCIVQQGESIDTLAERYKIQVQQLQKANHLEINQDVHEGQVLYIPQVFAKK